MDIPLPDASAMFWNPTHGSDTKASGTSGGGPMWIHGRERPPVHVAVDHEDQDGNRHRWDHGFIHHVEETGYRTVGDPDGAGIERSEMGAPCPIATVIPMHQWYRVSMEITDDTVRTDWSGSNMLPRPEKITRIMV